MLVGWVAVAGNGYAVCVTFDLGWMAVDHLDLPKFFIVVFLNYEGGAFEADFSVHQMVLR